MTESTTSNSRPLGPLQFLSKTHRSLHDQRRKSETQAFFTALTLYALLGAARFTSAGSLPNPLPDDIKVAVWIFVLLVAVASSAFLFAIHKSNQVNKTIAEDAEDQIREILKRAGVTVFKPDRPCHLFGYLPCICQIFLVLIFAAAAGFLLTRTYATPSSKTPASPQYSSISSDALSFHSSITASRSSMSFSLASKGEPADATEAAIGSVANGGSPGRPG